MNARTLSAIALLALSACGGDDFEKVGNPQTMFVDQPYVTVIGYGFTVAGTYELKVDGRIDCQTSSAVVGVDILAWPAVVDDGEPESTYEISDCKSTRFEQRVTYRLIGEGPWQVAVEVWHDQGPPVYLGGEPIHNVRVQSIQLSHRKID